LGLGVNLQKLYSTGMFTNFNNNQNPTEEIRISKSNFHAVLQPEITFILKTDKQIGYRLGLTYSYINWDKASSNFNFSNNSNSLIPSNKTSNLFLTGGCLYFKKQL
jgi:hypothetical protein